MARKKLTMRKIREIIRLHKLGLSNRKIAKLLELSRPAVAGYIKKFQLTGLSLEEFFNIDDNSFLDLINQQENKTNSKYDNLIERFPEYIKELKRVGVTQFLLWEEYRLENPDGYSHSQFSYHFNKWKDERKLSMHIEHKAGDKLFIDYTGKHLYITDRYSGQKTEVEIFLAVLGASQYTYMEATLSQQKEDWIKANENSLAYFGGVPRALVPDNLLSAITKASKYEPEINLEYAKFAEHYGTVIYPARPYKPKDKALVEGTVKIIYTRIFAPLRDRTFYSLQELNADIRPLLDDHNNKFMKNLKASRKELFEQIDSPALKPLPAYRYEMKECQLSKVHFNYHIYLKVDDHYYSVPYRYRAKKVEIWYKTLVIEVFYKNSRIAIHNRIKNSTAKYTTDPEHMPPEHKWINDWNPERFIKWAGDIGSHVRQMIEKVLDNAKYPEQSYKTCMGIINLHSKYKPNGKARLNKACRRALSYKSYSYKSINNILKNNLEDVYEPDLFSPLPEHENIRGQDYYVNKETI